MPSRERLKKEPQASCCRRRGWLTMQKWEYLNLVMSTEHRYSLRDIKKCKGFIKGFSQYKDVSDELPESFLGPLLRPEIANQL